MINKQYHIIKDALPDELCDHLIVDNFIYNKDNKLKVIPSNTDSILSNTKMSVEMVAHPCKSDLGKFFKQNARTTNKECDWHFHIDRIESIQIIKLKEGSSYPFHMDLTKPRRGKGFHQKQRKLSCILSLNNPSEYIGGNFKLQDINTKSINNIQSQLTKGSLLIFPSFIPHSMDEIEHGQRYNIVTWIEGLSFR